LHSHDTSFPTRLSSDLARWNHDIDLAGKSVGVIGNGASAIQFVPEIAPKAGHLTIFQRTPNWGVPKADRPFREWEKKLYRAMPRSEEHTSELQSREKLV